MKIISTNEAPNAIGPYSQGVQAGNFVFVSGQIPIDPKTDEVVNGGIKIQTIQVLENFKHVVEAAGATLKDVVKTTIFIRELNYFEEVNEVYGQYFKQNFPARACVEVSRLPKDVLVEIEGIIFKKR